MKYKVPNYLGGYRYWHIHHRYKYRKSDDYLLQIQIGACKLFCVSSIFYK